MHNVSKYTSPHCFVDPLQQRLSYVLKYMYLPSPSSPVRSAGASSSKRPGSEMRCPLALSVSLGADRARRVAFLPHWEIIVVIAVLQQQQMRRAGSGCEALGGCPSPASASAVAAIQWKRPTATPVQNGRRSSCPPVHGTSYLVPPSPFQQGGAAQRPAGLSRPPAACFAH